MKFKIKLLLFKKKKNSFYNRKNKNINKKMLI